MSHHRSAVGLPGAPAASSSLSPTHIRGALQVPPVPAEGALPALRAGGPVRYGFRQGAVQLLPTPAARAVAVSGLIKEVYATSTASAVWGRWACYERILDLWGMQPHPITPQKVLFLGAGLKRGGYRSTGSGL